MLWYFDMSLFDLKQLKVLSWFDLDWQGVLMLMLFFVVDDCFGVVYQEYVLVYGEDVEVVLCFLYCVMVFKEENLFGGIFDQFQIDGGLVGKFVVFNWVMDCFGIEVICYMLKGLDVYCIMVCVKGKVECLFCIVKEVYEMFYYFYEFDSEDEVNCWLVCYVVIYNNGGYCYEQCLCIEDWFVRLFEGGICMMCIWECYCVFVCEFE